MKKVSILFVVLLLFLFSISCADDDTDNIYENYQTNNLKASDKDEEPDREGGNDEEPPQEPVVNTTT